MNKSANCLNCIYLKDLTGKHCNTCKSVYESINDDKPVKVKQLIFNFSYKYGYFNKFDFKINDIELYSDEFKFYRSSEDIEIDNEIGIYQLTTEIFIPINSSNEYISQIKQEAIKAMENWFKNKIKDLTYGLEILKNEI